MGGGGARPAARAPRPGFSPAVSYPSPLRRFTDIDVLAAPEALPLIDAALADHGSRLVESHPREHKWLHRDNDSVMVEVQTDLVHADSLHDVMSLPYQAIAAAPEAAEALLLVALVHGGGHQYERLQQVVDICQAARALQGGTAERRFEEMVKAANARFIAGLTAARRSHLRRTTLPRDSRRAWSGSLSGHCGPAARPNRHHVHNGPSPRASRVAPSGISMANPAGWRPSALIAHATPL